MLLLIYVCCVDCSVLIGITVGVSSSPCTIRPLAAALVFHQFFEGFALGGALIDAAYKLCAPMPYTLGGTHIAAAYKLCAPLHQRTELGFDDISPKICQNAVTAKI